MLDTRIEFDERYDNEEYGTTTLYFTAPRELLSAKYPEAASTEISIEFPINHPEPRYATVMYSPTKYDEENEGYTDYDWFDVELTYGEIAALIELAEKSERI